MSLSNNIITHQLDPVLSIITPNDYISLTLQAPTVKPKADTTWSLAMKQRQLQSQRVISITAVFSK